MARQKSPIPKGKRKTILDGDLDKFLTKKTTPFALPIVSREPEPYQPTKIDIGEGKIRPKALSALPVVEREPESYIPTKTEVDSSKLKGEALPTLPVTEREPESYIPTKTEVDSRKLKGEVLPPLPIAEKEPEVYKPIKTEIDKGKLRGEVLPPIPVTEKEPEIYQPTKSEIDRGKLRGEVLPPLPIAEKEPEIYQPTETKLDDTKMKLGELSAVPIAPQEPEIYQPQKTEVKIKSEVLPPLPIAEKAPEIYTPSKQEISTTELRGEQLGTIPIPATETKEEVGMMPEVQEINWRDKISLSDPTSSKEALGMPSILGSDFLETPPSQLASGILRQNIIMKDGYLKSYNYVSGSDGWILNYDGTIEVKDMTLFGGIIRYGKTSFADSTNTGYYISSDGLYIGTAADASRLKYTLASGLLYVGDDDHYFSFDGVNANSTGIRYIEKLTAGESITVNEIVCFKKSVTDLQGSTYISKDSYTDSANGNTNYGTDPTLTVGSSAGVLYKAYFGFNIANSQPNKVLLRFYCNVGTIGTLEAYRVTSDWAENTITHNNQPTSTAVNETGVPTHVVANTGWQWIEMDVTNIIRGQMSTAWDEARGIMLYFTGGTGYITGLRSTEYTTDESQQPMLRVTHGIDLQSSGRVYIADNTDLNTAVKIKGVALETKTAGNTINIQTGGTVVGLTGLTAGQSYYLSTAGAIATKTSFALDAYITKIGTALTTTTLLLDIETEKYLWQSEPIRAVGNDTINYVFPPIDSNECVVQYLFSGSGDKGTATLKRNGPTPVNVGTIAAGPADSYITYAWDDTYNRITITNGAGIGADPQYTESTFYFYK